MDFMIDVYAYVCVMQADALLEMNTNTNLRNTICSLFSLHMLCAHKFIEMQKIQEENMPATEKNETINK